MREDVKSALGKASAGMVLLAFVAVAFVLFTWWRWGRFITSTIKYVVENLASRSGISTNLLYAIVIIGTIPFFWAVAKYMHGAWFWLRGLRPGLRLYKSIHGMIIVAYVGLYFLATYFVSRDSLAYKYCAVTPEGIKVFDDRVKDPVYGIQTEPCTFQQIVEIRRIKNPGLGPQRISVSDARIFAFFDPVTHNPRVWYHKRTDGTYEFFDRAGFDPETSAPLREMDLETRDDAIRLQDQHVAEQQQRNQDALAAQYINAQVRRRSENSQIAILILSSGDSQFAGLDEALRQATSGRGLTPVTSFFKPRFVQEGRAERLFAGDWDAVGQFGMADRVDEVLIGNASSSTTNSSEFEGLITTNLTLELKCLNTRQQSVCGTQSFTAAGAGYTKEDSLHNATEKVRPQIDAFVNALRLD
jgi:hypothetical protein